jgi:CheY-like chemotaxis protein
MHKPIKLLYVEDNQFCRDVFQKIIVHKGFDYLDIDFIDEPPNDITTCESYDGIILDDETKGEYGTEFAARAQEEYWYIPKMLVSGKDLKASKYGDVRDVVDDVCAKGDIKDLIDKVKVLIRQIAARRYYAAKAIAEYQAA